MQEYARAIEVYARFLHASEQLNDRELQGLAHNWLGVAHHQQADTAASKAQRHPGRVSTFRLSCIRFSVKNEGCATKEGCTSTCFLVQRKSLLFD